VALVPAPWVLLPCGDRVRAKNKFAAEVGG